MTTYTIRFPGGGRLTGTASEVLSAWGAMAYPPVLDSDEIKADLAKRAYIWDGALLDSSLDDAEFVRSLTLTTMVSVDVSNGR